MGLGIGPFAVPMETCTEGERVTVIRKCLWCHKESRVTVDREAFSAWISGAKVQDVFPALSADEREQLMSGTHPACWDAMWGEEE